MHIKKPEWKHQKNEKNTPQNITNMFLRFAEVEKFVYRQNEKCDEVQWNQTERINNGVREAFDSKELKTSAGRGTPQSPETLGIVPGAPQPASCSRSAAIVSVFGLYYNNMYA